MGPWMERSWGRDKAKVANTKRRAEPERRQGEAHSEKGEAWGAKGDSYWEEPGCPERWLVRADTQGLRHCWVPTPGCQ